MKILASNPFGASIRTAAKTVSKEGDEGKKIDLVSIYLATVPSLQKAKEELEKVRAALKDSETSGPKCDEWVTSIVKVMEDILDHTKVAIRGEIEAASPEKTPGAQAITPEMISGRQEIPSGTLR